MFGEVLQALIKNSPVAVMVRGLLENLLSADKIDHWFETIRQSQYTKDILFSSIVGLMLQVVCKRRPSVHSAYRDSESTASIVAVYDKLKGIETATSQGLVRQIASASETLIRNMTGANPPLLPGYRTKLLDGNWIEATEHRVKVLRGTRAGALPGKSLVGFDAELGIALDVFPCEDGQAQERALLSAVAETIQARDLWIADRNFCVLDFLRALHQKSAYFVIRQHGNTPYNSLTQLKFVKKSATGEVFEQTVEITAAGQTLQVRRVVVELAKPTRNGDRQLILLTNLPPETVTAAIAAELYRARWGIETAFQKVEAHLNSELNTLGYPKAALFGFCLALVAFNLYAITMAALRATHRDQAINESVSEYYIAQAIATTTAGRLIAVPSSEWALFAQANVLELADILLNIATHANLKKYKKNPRGPKKAPLERNQFSGQPHVSTAKLLEAAAAKAK